MWEDMVQPSISWNEIWRMSSYRLAFVIRSIFDQLPSKDNLRRWCLTEDCKYERRISETLLHVHALLLKCKYDLDNGRYTWRYNKVLKEVVKAKMAVARSKFLQDCVAAEGIFFVRGLFTNLQEKQIPSKERHSCRS